MAASSSNEPTQSDPPLWTIGLIMVIVGGVPMVLYSLAPPGPLREGDTVFSDGQQRVQMLRTIEGSVIQQPDTCLLDPDNPLTIAQEPTDQANGTLVVKVQGHSRKEWPFCPSPAEVLLTVHQIVQKPDVLRVLKKSLTGLVTR